MIEESAPAPTAGRGSNVEHDPTAEPEDKRKQRRKRLVDLAIGSTFLIPGLAISGWSMYSYMRESTNAPAILCLGASAAFDGIGLYAAKKANERAEKGRKAKFAWIVTWAAVAASVVINWRHASTQHWNEGIHILISAPAAAAAAAFEIMMQETRETERDKHEKRIRTRRPVKIDLDIWLHHPLKVWGSRRKESAQRLDEALAIGARSASVTAPRHTEAPASEAPQPERRTDGATRHAAPQPTPRATAPQPNVAPQPLQDAAPQPPVALPVQRATPTEAPHAAAPQSTGATQRHNSGATPAPTTGATPLHDTDTEDTGMLPVVLSAEDEAALDAAEPPMWRDLTAAEAVRRFDQIVPGRSATQAAAMLAARGVEVRASYVRTIRTRERSAGRHASNEAPDGQVFTLERRANVS